MSRVALVDHLNTCLGLARWSATELWLAAVALGTDLAQEDIASIRRGEGPVSRAEYGFSEGALGEHFAECGMDHPVLEWDDLEQS
jgi:hypothetical protein